MPRHGADISHHQTGVNLAAAHKAGLQWLYHKCTEGNSFVDGSFATRRAQAKAAGLPFGGYHFARPSAKASDGAAEARFFLSHCKPAPGDLRPALDLETTEGLSMSQVRAWAKSFVDEVKAQLGGVHPVVYGPYDLGSAVSGCLLWRPRYSPSNMRPALHWDIWQFSDGKYGVPNSLPGLGHCDLNTMRDGVTTADLRIPAKKTTAPKPPTKENDVKIKWKGHRLELVKWVVNGYDPHGNPAQVAALKKILAAVDAAPWVDEPTGMGTILKAAAAAAKKAVGLK